MQGPGPAHVVCHETDGKTHALCILPILGAVLIKNYSIYLMKQKMLHVFFLWILTYQSTLNICTLPKREAPPLLLPILLNTIIKINHRCKEFAILILHSHGFGNLVAWRHNLRLPPQSQSWDFCFTATKKVDHNDRVSVIRTKPCPWQGRTPSFGKKDTGPLPKIPPDMIWTFLFVCGVSTALQTPSRPHKKYWNFLHQPHKIVCWP